MMKHVIAISCCSSFFVLPFSDCKRNSHTKTGTTYHTAVPVYCFCLFTLFLCCFLCLRWMCGFVERAFLGILLSLTENGEDDDSGKQNHNQ